MKKTVIVTCLLFALGLIGSVSADLLVDLDASGLPEGDITSWTNAGTAGGEFVCSESEDDETADPNAFVVTIDGRKGVYFADGSWMESDIVAPSALSGANPWTVAVWADANSVEAGTEDCLFQWGDRDWGVCAQFNYGTYAFTTFLDDVFYDNAPSAGEWVYLVATYDGTTIKVYVNGMPDYEGERSFAIAEGDYMRIARAMPDLYGTHPYTGAIASIQVYDEALSRSEIQDLMGEFVESGELSPSGLELTEGESADLTLQINTNIETASGPTEDLEVTLSFIDAYADASLGTSVVGDPYVVTVPAATYSDPITVSITIEDDTVLEATHDLLVQAVVTDGDADYVANPIVPVSGLAITVVDNDYLPCPDPELEDGAYVDEFDCEWDYTQGTSSMWTGLMDEDGCTTDATASVTTSGVLHLESANGSWGSGSSTGPFLYVDVTGDFEAETYVSEYANSIEDEDGVYYNAGGLMVRLSDDLATDGQDCIQPTYFPIYNGDALWYDDDGVRTETDQTDDGWEGDRYFKVIRQGADFYCYHSPDGEDWTVFPSANPLVRDDMNVDTLQVGLYQCTYSTETGFVEFDYFSLKKSRGSISGTLNLTESEGDSGTVQLQFDTDGVSAPLADIDVTLTAVATASADPNSDPNDVMIETSAMGEPYTFTIPAAEYDQVQTITVTAVVDTYTEPDQQVTLEAEVASTDPNWNGLFLTPQTEINVLEDPGLLIDTDDGVEVSEDGTPDTFTVRLKVEPAATVTVDIVDDSDPAQVTVSPTQLSFDSSTWKDPVTVTVTAEDDTTLEDDPHTTTLSLTATDGADYDSLDPFTVDVSVLENECGAWGYSWADFDTDCDVDIDDLLTMAEEWLNCSRPYDTGCVDLR